MMVTTIAIASAIERTAVVRINAFKIFRLPIFVSPYFILRSGGEKVRSALRMTTLDAAILRANAYVRAGLASMVNSHRGPAADSSSTHNHRRLGASRR